MRFASLIAVLSLGACTHMKLETIPHGPAGDTFATDQSGAYTVKAVLDAPHTQAMTWTVACEDGVNQAETLGLPFASYRESKLAQLNQPRQAAIAANERGPQTRTAYVNTPLGRVAVRETDPPPPVPPEITELAPGDVGTTHYESGQTITVGGRTQCRVFANGEDGPVRLAFTVTHYRDLDADARAAREAAAVQGLAFRASVTQHFVALGADPQARERRRAAELAVVHARELTRVQVQTTRDMELAARARARAELDVRIRSDAYALREYYIAYFVGHCHGDAERRGRRLAEEAQQQQIHLEAERVRFAAAVRFRGSLTDYLLASGARLKPPRPALIAEVAGTAPFPGAVWTAGRWEWHEDAWQWGWIAGGWSDPTRFQATGGDAAVAAPVAVAPVAATVDAPVEAAVDAPVVIAPVVVGPAPVVIGPAPTIVIQPGHGGHVVGTHEHHVHRAPPPPPPQRHPAAPPKHR